MVGTKIAYSMRRVKKVFWIFFDIFMELLYQGHTYHPIYSKH